MVIDHTPEYDSQWQAIRSISAKFGMGMKPKNKSGCFHIRLYRWHPIVDDVRTRLMNSEHDIHIPVLGIAS